MIVLKVRIVQKVTKTKGKSKERGSVERGDGIKELTLI